jgi:hypothetical protein
MTALAPMTSAANCVLIQPDAAIVDLTMSSAARIASATGATLVRASDRSLSAVTRWPAVTTMMFMPMASTGTVIDRRSRGVLADVYCRRGIPTFVGGDDVESGRLLVIADGCDDETFVQVVSAVSEVLSLRIEVVGLNGRGGGTDVGEAAAARSLARRITEVSVRDAHWDVLHGRSRFSALRNYVADTRPAAVAIPHHWHQPGSCETLTLTRRLRLPVLFG